MKAIINAIPVLALAGLVGLIFGAALNITTANNAAQLVFTQCNNARMELNGGSEAACGNMQDKYNIEFLCDEANSLPTNHCWTEIK